MAERVGNPVPREIRDALERGEEPLVYELVTPPKDDGAPEPGTSAAGLAGVLADGAQHELLLTKNRVVVVTTDRRTRSCSMAWWVPHDEIVALDHVGSGSERGRIRVDFRDGSTTSLVMGLLLPRPARRFLAAYDEAMPGRAR